MNEVRRPIVEWTRQNAITDDYYPDAPITIDTANNTITIETFMRSPDGDIMLHGSGYMFTELRTYPMLVPPSPGLLEAYARLRLSIAEENSTAAAIRRETVHSLIEVLQEAGFSDAAQHLALSKLAGNPVSSRQMVRFDVEVARFEPRFDGGPYPHRSCSFHVREGARLYLASGTIVGWLDWAKVKYGALWLSGQALPHLVKQFEERTHYPSLDTKDVEWTEGSTGALSKLQINGATVLEIAHYPWHAAKKEDSDVRP